MFVLLWYYFSFSNRGWNTLNFYIWIRFFYKLPYQRKIFSILVITTKEKKKKTKKHTNHLERSEGYLSSLATSNTTNQRSNLDLVSTDYFPYSLHLLLPRMSSTIGITLCFYPAAIAGMNYPTLPLHSSFFVFLLNWFVF